MYTARFKMSTNGNVSIQSCSRIWIINSLKSPIKQIIETLMNIISLQHYYIVALNGRMSDPSNGVNLRKMKQNIVILSLPLSQPGKKISTYPRQWYQKNCGEWNLRRVT